MYDSAVEFLPGVLFIYGAFVLLLLSPGPNTMAVMGTSMSVNRKSGIAMGLGIAAGTLFWSCLTVLGVTNFITAYAWSLAALKVFGGVYLIWLAYKSMRLACIQQRTDRQYQVCGNARKFFVLGFSLNVSNPKAAFGWIAIISLGMKPDAPTWVSVALILATVTTSIFFHVLYAVAFSSRPAISIYKRVGRWIHGLFGFFFLYAGVKVLTSKS